KLLQKLIEVAVEALVVRLLHDAEP
ncbi:MAG: hypothetical protein QOC86_1811, partial [Gaiellales bacterium]|nr:hypothetical protein [Gaiellales bacterium]